MEPSNLQILPQSFYDRDTIVVAKELLGAFLVRKIGDDILIGKIVETEAYLAFDDPAAHNFIGKTKRNEVLFGEPGRLYVHSMRQYFCMDVVTEGVDFAGSVLIRALEPIEGIDSMQKLRNTHDIHNLCSGPSKLCMAFAIDKSDNGISVTNPASSLFISKGLDRNDTIITKSRIGITKNEDALLRFYIKGNEFISKP